MADIALPDPLVIQVSAPSLHHIAPDMAPAHIASS